MALNLRNFRYIWALGLMATGLIIIVPVALFASATEEAPPIQDPWDFVPADTPHTDHSSLMNTQFSTGREVTAACLECHPDSAHEVSMTSHWTWLSEPVEVEGRAEPVSIGKANTLNNYCIGIQSNWGGCTRCHAGYGWKDADYDFADTSGVDCLICHDQSGQYAKTTAGEVKEGVDLLAAAQSVASPTRENCGTCHFNGGGGNGVKHGDMDESLYFPSENLDVHMGRLDFVCIDCHRTEDHNVRGRVLSLAYDSENGIACTDCHAQDLHDDDRLNLHTPTLACQTCHIPSGAVRSPTKMEWDWSTAGQDLPEDPHQYLKIKGSFVYEENFTPEYMWYNGTADHYLLGDPINPNGVTVLNPLYGDIHDPQAQIFPFKVHRARQPYDTVYNYLLQPQTTGETGYWTTFDWDSALANGSAAVGMDYSGEYGFAQTEMNWQLSHMVAPAEFALQCTDCHGEGQRMDWAALRYNGDPIYWGGRDLPAQED